MGHAKLLDEDSSIVKLQLYHKYSRTQKVQHFKFARIRLHMASEITKYP